ncbi:hypothetical protein WKW79_23675 [Variovorax robiniae]|uniref:Uncharacterized protein n=1 Tax=Variovorax robiniae TaxID=1836199 RepID=A0ABU8XCM5_9BURK
MKKQPQGSEDWWHERPTKTAELSTNYQSLGDASPKQGHVWKKAALVVGLMFALVLSLISMMTRG